MVLRVQCQTVTAWAFCWRAAWQCHPKICGLWHSVHWPLVFLVPLFTESGHCSPTLSFQVSCFPDMVVP